jgi:hypothetical protein
MTQEYGTVQVDLYGGPMDGDSIILSPAGSISPPQQLYYLSATKNQAAWMVYEAANVFKSGWPIENENRRFDFVGWYSLGKTERIE